MTKKTDLRIIKTKRNIKKTFLDLLTTKPLDKITVTELAAAAEINKGTFYLHYTDIYNLYSEVLYDFVEQLADQIDFYNLFFTNPEAFVMNFLNGPKSTEEFQKFYIFTPEYSTYNHMLPLLLTEATKKRIYATGQILPSVENDIKLDAILAGLSFIVRKEYPPARYGIISEIIGKNIRSSFS